MEIQTIKQYMRSNKITYEELANRSGLSISTIKKIFSGISQYPRIDTMQAIEQALELNQAPLQWTEKEKAAGVLPNYAENLSADEVALIDAYRAIKSEKGEQAAHAIKTIVETYLDKK